MYLYNKKLKHFIIENVATDSFLKELEYLSMKINLDQATIQQKTKS